MKHPSIRFRLILGTGLLVAITLFGANYAIYRVFKSTIYKEVDAQLLQSASLLAKSAELEATSLDYEWQEAMKLSSAPEIVGVFEFWDLKSGRTTKSPELGDRDLPLRYGKLDEPVLKNFTFPDGRHIRIVGLLHLPFTDQESIDLAATMGKNLSPGDYPQVVVCARETESISSRLAELRGHLIRGALATLLVIWAAIFAISTWCLRPIRELNVSLLKRSESEAPGAAEIPDALPLELVGLAQTFNTALDRVEQSRAREKEFALHAAHELRTPISGIYATLEQALHRPRVAEDLNSRIHEALTIVAGMRVTLDSLMRLARLRGRTEVSSKSSFEPLQIINDSFKSVEGIIRNRKLRIRFESNDNSKPLSSDPGLFQIIVSNLIENAVRYAPENTEIRVDALSDGDGFSLSVSNACREADTAELARWFEPFQRGSGAADQEGGHAGLGLSLSREAATLLGGSLIGEAVENTICFTATIP